MRCPDNELAYVCNTERTKVGYRSVILRRGMRRRTLVYCDSVVMSADKQLLQSTYYLFRHVYAMFSINFVAGLHFM